MSKSSSRAPEVTVERAPLLSSQSDAARYNTLPSPSSTIAHEPQEKHFNLAGLDPTTFYILVRPPSPRAVREGYSRVGQCVSIWFSAFLNAFDGTVGMSLLLPPLALSHDIEEGGVGANGDSRDAAWTDLVELSSDEPQLLARDFPSGFLLVFESDRGGDADAEVASLVVCYPCAASPRSTGGCAISSGGNRL